MSGTRTTGRSYPGQSYEQIMAKVMRDVERINSNLGSLLYLHLAKVKSKTQFTSQNLTHIPDTFERLSPLKEKCPDGIIQRVQFVNWKNDIDRDGSDVVLFNETLFNSPQFSSTDRAALMVHEIVYSFLREEYLETNSINTRRIVGLLFSNLDLGQKREKILSILNNRSSVVSYRPVMSTSEKIPQVWKYTLKKPSAHWMSASFDDDTWNVGLAGFGTSGTPGAVVRTEWATKNIWLRRQFETAGLSKNNVKNLVLRIYYDENATVYINGVKALEARGWSLGYVYFKISPEALKTINLFGPNVIAVNCKQITGGQGIDVGLELELNH